MCRFFAFPAYTGLEYVMPDRFDIRLNLLVLWPAPLLNTLALASKMFGSAKEDVTDI